MIDEVDQILEYKKEEVNNILYNLYEAGMGDNKLKLVLIANKPTLNLNLDDKVIFERNLC